MALGLALAGMVLGAFAHSGHSDESGGEPPATASVPPPAGGAVPPLPGGATGDAAFTSQSQLTDLAGREGSCPACLHLQRIAGADLEQPLNDLSRPAFASASLSRVPSLHDSEALSRTGGRAPPFRA